MSTSPAPTNGVHSQANACLVWGISWLGYSACFCPPTVSLPFLLPSILPSFLPSFLFTFLFLPYPFARLVSLFHSWMRIVRGTISMPWTVPAISWQIASQHAPELSRRLMNTLWKQPGRITGFVGSGKMDFDVVQPLWTAGEDVGSFTSFHASPTCIYTGFLSRFPCLFYSFSSLTIGSNLIEKVYYGKVELFKSPKLRHFTIQSWTLVHK